MIRVTYGNMRERMFGIRSTSVNCVIKPSYRNVTYAIINIHVKEGAWKWT